MAFRSSSIAQGTGNLAPSLPAGTVSTDIVVALIGSTDTNMTVTPPAGWTLIREQDESTNFFSTAFAYWALGNVASTSFTLSGTSAKSIVLASFSGRNTTAPITISGGNQGYTTSSAALPSVTASAGDDLCAIWSSDALTGTGSPPSPWTTASSGNKIRTGYQDNVSAGSTAASVVTLDYAESWATIVVAITVGSVTTVDQQSFRWGVDDGSESAHTWAASQDANLTAPANQARLIRALVDATGDPASTAYALRYQKNGTGGYVSVPVGAGTSPTIGTVVSGTVGYSAINGNSVAPSYPAGIAANDTLVLIIGQKPSTANGGTATTPSGWTLRASRTGANDGDTGGYTTTLGADTGNTNIYVYTKDSVDGTESGTLSVTVGTNNVCWGNILLLPKTDAGTWSIAADTGKDTTAGNVSIASSAGMNVAAGDMLIGAMVIPTDVTTPSQFTSEAFSQSGTTFGTANELQEPDSTTGNDIGGFIFAQSASSGSGTGVVTMTATAGGTTTNVRGPGIILRARVIGLSNEVFISPSSNIAAGGEATTARLAPPSGKTTADFVTGRRWDDENGADSIDITANDYTEVEWSVGLSSAPTNGDYFDFRVYAGASPLNAYSTTARWTVGSAGSITTIPTGVASTGSAGTVTPVALAIREPTGVVSTGSAGTVTPVALAIREPTGVASTGSAGAVTPVALAIQEPTGVASTGSAGAVTVQVAGVVNVTATPTGVASTGSAGSLEKAFTSVGIAGVNATGNSGTVTVQVAGVVNVTATPTGVVSTGSAGTVTPVALAIREPTGVASTGSAGTVTPVALAIREPTGVVSTGSAGVVTVSTTTNTAAAPNGVGAIGNIGELVINISGINAVVGVESTGIAEEFTATATDITELDGAVTVGSPGNIVTEALQNNVEIITGVVSSGSANTVETITLINPTVIVPAVSSYGGIGTVGTATSSVGPNADVTPLGVATTGETGSVQTASTHNIDVALLGVVTIGGAGSIAIAANDGVFSPTSTPLGVASVGTSGEVSLNATTVIGISNVSAVGVAGSVSVFKGVNASTFGANSIGLVNTVTIEIVNGQSIWVNIDDSQSANWVNIDDSQDADWVDVADSQTANWVDIAV